MRAYTARMVRAVDGRTLVVNLAFPPFGLRLDATVTLEGYECPSMEGPEADLGLRARRALEQELRGRDFELYVSGTNLPGHYTAAILTEEAIGAMVDNLAEGNATNASAPALDVAERLIARGFGRAPGERYVPFDRATYPGLEGLTVEEQVALHEVEAPV